MLCSKAFPEDSTRLCNSVMAAVTQVKVADALKKRAPETKPDLFINVGDNFYWGGVNTAPRHWNWCSMLHFRVNKQSSEWSRSRVDAACDSWIQLPCENLRTAAHQWTRFILSQRTSSLRSSSVCILDQVPPYATIAIRGYGRDYSSMSLLCRCWQEALAQRLGQSRLRRSALKGNWKTAGDNGSFGMHNSGKKKDKQQNKTITEGENVEWFSVDCLQFLRSVQHYWVWVYLFRIPIQQGQEPQGLISI